MDEVDGGEGLAEEFEGGEVDPAAAVVFAEGVEGAVEVVGATLAADDVIDGDGAEALVGRGCDATGRNQGEVEEVVGAACQPGQEAADGGGEAGGAVEALGAHEGLGLTGGGGGEDQGGVVGEGVAGCEHGGGLLSGGWLWYQCSEKGPRAHHAGGGFGAPTFGGNGTWSKG
ncbi:MAG TPA: hypothetical protein VFZ76_04170 [Anaerolineales bacterium]